MSPAEKIVEAFGGLRSLAMAVRSPVSTVQHWKQSGYIPSRHIGKVLGIARRDGIPVTPEDFIEIPPDEMLPPRVLTPHGTATS